MALSTTLATFGIKMTHAELNAVGIRVSAEVWAQLAEFLARLLHENELLNLTAVRDADAAWRLHVVDSLALLPALQMRPQACVLDLGSGGGVPGIPLAIAAPTARITLLDATRKKVDAQQRIVAALGLANVRCVWGRAELVAHERVLRAAFDVVVTRAVAKLSRLLEWSAPFLKPGGECWCMKGPDVDEELAAAANAARRAGLVLSRRYEYELADRGRRTVLEFTRVR